ncbi:MAG: SPOR domain-containing protein [Granulosicoccus sp.]
MASTPKTEAAPGNRLFVLALGLLVGFVIGFVMLLSRLPIDDSLGRDSSSALFASTSASDSFEFYSVLPGQKVERKPAAAPVVVEDVTKLVVIPPATRVVPGSAQRLNTRNLSAENYAEIPASSLGQESYFLQAGNFRRPDEAERARAAVMILGLDAFIVVRQDNSGAVGHRVRIGPFFDQVKVTNAKKRLRKGGIDYKVIRVTG